MNKPIKAWLNYNCTQGNNWIVTYKFDEIIAHEGRKLYHYQEPIASDQLRLSSKDLSHIYFTYMTDSALITLIQTYDGRIFLISNKVSIVELPSDTAIEVPTTIDLVNRSQPDNLMKVDNILPLPQLNAIESNIYQLDNITQIRGLLTKTERQTIGINDKEWLAGRLKRKQRDELNGLSFLDFIQCGDDDQYVSLLDKYIEQSGEVLNLMYNYSVTPDKLKRIKMHPNIKQLVIYQNFQINDFEWLSKLPNVKLINLFYNHQIEQRHFEQIVQILPELEVFNIHYCSRINLRVIIPLLKLRHLNKLAIEDPQFWCQKSIHEVFILPDEWKNIFCPSLKRVAINSYNLTLDVIDYLITACPNIDQITVDENVIKSLSKNVEGGLNKNEAIVFNCWQNPSKGFKIHKKLIFKNLLKDTYNTQMFSDSMLKKIREIRTRKGEAEQTSMEDSPAPQASEPARASEPPRTSEPPQASS